MNQSDQLLQLLALALAKLDEPLVVSLQVLRDMKPMQVIIDDQTVPGSLKISVLSAEVLLAKVYNDTVEVLV